MTVLYLICFLGVLGTFNFWVKMGAKFFGSGVRGGRTKLDMSLGKVHYLRDGGRHITEILITVANHLIYASFLHNILFGP